MTIGSVAIACRGSVVTTVLTKIEHVKSSGAVSPAARATATMVAVTIPPTAVGRITVRTVRVREAPSAMLPSRSVDGTSSSTSSVARAIKGSMMIARPSAAGESALAAADHDQAEDEHADHDGGHAGQHVQREPDRLGQPLGANSVLKIASSTPIGSEIAGGDQDDDHRADDRVFDATAGFAERRRVLGEEVEVQRREGPSSRPRSARSRARPPRAAPRRSPGLP